MRLIQRSLLVIIFLAVSVYATPLDDLLSTYNFDVTSTEISVTRISHFFIDTNNNGKFDQLFLNLTLNGTSGNYSVAMSLFDGVSSVDAEQSFFLSDGENNVSIEFNTKLLRSQSYSLSFTIEKDYLIVYNDENARQIPVPLAQLEPPTFNAAALGNYLPNNKTIVVQVQVTSSKSGTYLVRGFMGDQVSTKSASLPGIVEFSFNASKLRLARTNESTFYKVEIVDGNLVYSFDTPLFLTFNPYLFDAGQSVLTDRYTESVVRDGSGPIQTLLIDVGIDRRTTSPLTLRAEVYDLFDQLVTVVESQNSQLAISGQEMYQSKLNGPYVLKGIQLKKGNDVLDSGLSYTTSAYVYSDFTPPPRPDLVLAKNDVVRSGGNVVVTVRNIGSVPAIGTTLSVTNENFQTLYEAFVGDVVTKKILTIPTLTSNSLVFTLDEDDQIDEVNESNNLVAFHLAAPNLDPIPDFTVVGGGVISLRPNVSDPNGNVVVLSLNDSRFVRQGDQFVWQTTAGDIGVYSFNLTASDGIFRVSEIFRVSVESAPPSSRSIAFSAGWNLVSFPIYLINPSLPAALGSLPYTTIFRYSTNWSMFEKQDPSLSFFSALSPDLGYWVYVLSDSVLSLQGSQGDVFYTLSSGWNLISYPGTVEQPIGAAMENVTVVTVFGYEGGEWKSYQKSRQENSLLTLKPGRGYWVQVPWEQNWTYSGMYRER